MIYGYARVSTKGQARDGNSLEFQENQLREQGAEKIFLESFTGTKRHRPELDKLIEIVSKGDTIVVTKLDRIARNAKDGLDIVDTILAKGCKINIINMGMFDDSPMGKMARTMMFAFAEFERDMIVQRTQEGKAIAKQRPDFKEGRPEKELVDFEYYVEMYKDKRMTVNSICKELNISNGTFYNRLSKLSA